MVKDTESLFQVLMQYGLILLIALSRDGKRKSLVKRCQLARHE